MPASSTPASECWPEEAGLRGGRTPAKPWWSEVMIFWDVVLRQGTPSPEESAGSGEAGAHWRTALRRVSQRRLANAGRRRLGCEAAELRRSRGGRR